MMDLPANVVDFASVPHVIESYVSIAKNDVNLVAHTMERLFEARTIYVTMPKVPAPNAAPPSKALPSPASGEFLDPEDYKALLTDIRSRIQKEGMSGPGHFIDIVEYAEGAANMIAMAKARLGSAATHSIQNYIKASGGRAFTTIMPKGHDDFACTVVGMSPDQRIRDLVDIYYHGPANFGSVTAKDLHTMADWHEVGHCLLGASEIHADAFGLLMAIQHGVSKEAIILFSTIRASMEMMTSNQHDGYFTAPASQWIAAHYDRLQGDKNFMSMNMAQTATLAKGIADRLAIDEKSLDEFRTMRQTLLSAHAKDIHWIKTADGLESTDLNGWLEHNASRVPVFARLLDLKDRLEKGPTSPLPAYTFDFKAYAAEIEELAREGDPTATTMVEALKNPKLPIIPPSPIRSPFSFTGSAQLAGKFFAMDTSNVKVVFSHDQTGFVGKDIVSGHAIVAGDVKTGVDRQINHYDYALRH